jgi:hypothetical protein
MVTLRAVAGSRGRPPRRPGRSNMDLRQTAVNTLSYQLDRAPKLRPPGRRQRGLEPRSANVHAAPGPAAGRGWTKRSSGLVGGGWPSAKQVSSTPNQPHRGFRPTEGNQDGSDRDVLGSHRYVTPFFSLRLSSRAALHVQIRGGNMTSVSSSNSTELGYGVLALKPAQPTGTARQLRRAARAPRTGSRWLASNE